MIHISKEQLRQVEYLIGQSIKGHHVLFDVATVRRVFENKIKVPLEDAPELEKHIETMILQPTLLQKRAYLEKLDPKTYDSVVRTYFNIVENNLYESAEITH